MKSEIKIREIQPNQKSINFFELSNEQFEDFKRQIANNEGVLEVYIHPFQHLNQAIGTASDSKYAEEKTIETQISRKLSTKSAKPSLIFEEDGYHEELERHIQNSETPVIFIVTYPNSAKPKAQNITASNIPLRIISKLIEAGVKEIQLAGAVLIKKWKGGKPVLEGCVGEAAHIFGNDFKVTFLENLTVIDERPKPQLRYDNE